MRVKRGREKKRSEGHLTSGIPLYGYMKNKDKTVSIDPETSEVVREIYNRFLDGETCGLISRDLWQRGTWSGRRSWTVTSYVSSILRDPRYKGTVIYPRLISDEDWNKAEEIRTSSGGTFARKTNTKEIYLSQGLVYTEAGYAMSSSQARNRYITKAAIDGEQSFFINMDGLDRLSSYVLKQYLRSEYIDNNKENELNALYKESKNIEKKLKEAEIQKEKIEKENKMINQRIIKGRLSESDGDQMIDDNNKSLFNIEEMILDLNKRSNEIINRVIFINSFAYDGSIQDSFESPKKEQEVLRQYLKKITVYKCDRGFRRIVYEWKTGLTQEFKMYSARLTMKYWDKDGNLIEDPILKKKWRSI
jgi:hypothetical protein